MRYPGCDDLISKCCVVICIQLWLCTYEIPRLLSLLVLACIASKDESDILSKFGVSTPALLCEVYRYDYRNFGVSACLLYDGLPRVVVFGCAAIRQARGLHSSVAV